MGIIDEPKMEDILKSIRRILSITKKKEKYYPKYLPYKVSTIGENIEMISWCKKTFTYSKGHRYGYTVSHDVVYTLGNPSTKLPSNLWYFENSDDAMQFKLVWG